MERNTERKRQKETVSEIAREREKEGWGGGGS